VFRQRPEKQLFAVPFVPQRQRYEDQLPELEPALAASAHLCRQFVMPIAIEPGEDVGGPTANRGCITTSILWS
jgi:hypothetical protein